jgi:KaiC/GvpD/RAD55 family RecA-like ATPase
MDLRQMEGLERALSLPPYGFLAVEDPPGTGKTSIIAAAACEIVTAGGKRSPRRLQTWPLTTP